MRTFFAVIALATLASAQSEPREQALGWRFAVQDDATGPAALGIAGAEVSARQLPANASHQGIEKLRADLRARQLAPVVYRANAATPAAIALASKLGVQLVVVPSTTADISALVRAA